MNSASDNEIMMIRKDKKKIIFLPSIVAAANVMSLAVLLMQFPIDANMFLFIAAVAMSIIQIIFIWVMYPFKIDTLALCSLACTAACIISSVALFYEGMPSVAATVFSLGITFVLAWKLLKTDAGELTRGDDTGFSPAGRDAGGNEEGYTQEEDAGSAVDEHDTTETVKPEDLVFEEADETDEKSLLEKDISRIIGKRVVIESDKK